MLIYDDGIIKGVINRIITDDAVEICEFYVEPVFKGNGIGKQCYASKTGTVRLLHLTENQYNNIYGDR